MSSRPSSDYIHCRRCSTPVALVEDYILTENDFVTAGFFNRMFNVEVSEDERYQKVIDVKTLAETYCVQCRHLLGWKLIAISQPSRNYREGFYMRLDELTYWNDVTLLDFLCGGDNDQDGGADEEHGGPNERNADQDGGANELVPKQEVGANEQRVCTNERNADQDGGANELVPKQEVGTNEQNVGQDGDTNELVPKQEAGTNEQVSNEQGVCTNEQNVDQDVGTNQHNVLNFLIQVICLNCLSRWRRNEQNHDHDGGAPMN